MDPALRRAFNESFTEARHGEYLARLEAELGCHIPFRVAETPLFFPPEVRARLEADARGIVEEICRPELIARTRRAIPAHLDAPGEDDLASCLQVDLAITRDASGAVRGELVELQGFPSLYGLIVLQSRALAEQLEQIGLGRGFSPFFGGLTEAEYVSRLRATIVGDADPREVVLLDLDPPSQKTYPDFVATKRLIGVDAVCPTSLVKDGRALYRVVDGARVPVRRIFHRVVFDELEKKGVSLPFRYTDPLDVTWVPHPNWYWTWSKVTLPLLSHPAVPRATLLSELDEVPRDLSRHVLKPLFSFAGAGVKVDVTRADVDAVPDAERAGWVLQEKIDYAPALHTPRGEPVKAEVRMMFLRPPGAARPELVMNLVRLSRGKMLGVDQNRDLDWVGGTVGLSVP
ncbi:MAG: hypothetical protein IT374_17810 [Polyangiaceae bacterium]|nr:hypothetical protein [Polyangiaceae bacterium]